MDWLLVGVNDKEGTEMSQQSVPDCKVHVANMGPTWVLSAPDGPHVGPMNLTIRDDYNPLWIPDKMYVVFLALTLASRSLPPSLSFPLLQRGPVQGSRWCKIDLLINVFKTIHNPNELRDIIHASGRN